MPTKQKNLRNTKKTLSRTFTENEKTTRNKPKKTIGSSYNKKVSNPKSSETSSEKKNPNSVRLQKFLAECGVASRRQSELLITEGRVKVNGKVVTKLGTQIDPTVDKVVANGVHLKVQNKGIILFNKPRFVVSTMFDPEGRPCVADYLTKQYRNYFPVGRLDWESSGLIILTNDGEMADRLMHPKYEVERSYEVRVEGDFNKHTAIKLEKGVKLEDGKAFGIAEYISSDANSTWIKVTVKEGRNRLVRRMMQELGHPVIKLRRISHGPFNLKRLQPGEIRKLLDKEYKLVREKVMERRAPARLLE